MEPFLGAEPAGWPMIVDAALGEDVGNGDVTQFAVPEAKRSYYEVEAQAHGIVCGVGIALDLLTPLGDAQEDEFAEFKVVDGDAVEPGTVVLAGRMQTRELLRNERTALNFLMHLSGIATLTSKFVAKCDGTNAEILDTRKTLPGMRMLQKYAVECGGGRNHRKGLYDGILIKDNHVKAAGGIAHAIKAVRAKAPHTMKIEVECTTVAQVDRAITAGADIILLDNMSTGEMKDAVGIGRGRVLLEASGGVTLETVEEIAKTGVDFISVGAITHSSPALPFHLEFR
ncbi:MAG TPA: carboxylating nicotinate-nucleotide diphosphorylase [Fimbriimonadales bacterium]|nr:carboxylating nicotinate-nucleotide diphosphorylase [Fimbriimonadales bacterium]